MYHVWHWWKWGFGQWHRAHSGTKEECMQWARSQPGDWVVAEDKPTFVGGPIGREIYGGYHSPSKDASYNSADSKGDSKKYIYVKGEKQNAER